MPLISENFADVLEKGLRKIFVDHFESQPEMRPLIFQVEKDDTSQVRDSSIGAFGDFSPFTGQVSYQDVYQQYDVTYTHIEYTAGMKVERRLVDDDLYGIINRRAAGMGISARRTQEKLAANVFNNAFSGTGTIVVDGTNVLNHTEALSLCNNAHTSTTPGASTQDNLFTAALSPTAVETARRAMLRFTDDKGNYINTQPDLLLCPLELEETAYNLISSKGVVDSAENNVNFHFGKYKLAVWNYLTDANDWFMIDSAMAKMFLFWFDRIPVEFKQDGDFDTFQAKYAAYWRAAWGWSDWRWLAGHQVA